MARGGITCRITGTFVLLKLVVSKLPDFEFLFDGIIRVRFKGLKGIALSLTAVLIINVRFKPLGRVIIYKVLFYVLSGYVFGAAFGFLVNLIGMISIVNCS